MSSYSVDAINDAFEDAIKHTFDFDYFGRY